MQYSKVAASDILPAVFVKLGMGDGTALTAGVGDQPFGVSTIVVREQIGGLVETFAAKIGDNIIIKGPGELGIPRQDNMGGLLTARGKLINEELPFLVIGVGGCKAGDRLKPDVSGFGIVAKTPGDIFGAVALFDAGEQDMVEVQVVESAPIHTAVT